MSDFNTMNTDTPRTDEALSLHYSEGDYFGEETTKEAYEFARGLERELNEMTAKQIELVNHLRLYRGQVNNEENHTAKSVDSIDWLTELDSVKSFDMKPREFDGYEMRETEGGTYLRYGDVRQLLRKLLSDNNKIAHSEQNGE